MYDELNNFEGRLNYSESAYQGGISTGNYSQSLKMYFENIENMKQMIANTDFEDISLSMFMLKMRVIWRRKTIH